MDQNIIAIQSAIPFLVRAIGRKAGVTVHIGGGSAKTDGQVIYLPDLPIHNPVIQQIAFGYTEHEAAHIRYSDTLPVETYISATHKYLTNLFEDIRIEMLLFKEYPGFRYDYNLFMQHLIEVDFFTEPDVKDQTTDIVRAYLLYRLRFDALGQTAFQKYADLAQDLVVQMLPEGAYIKLAAALGRVNSLTSTQDASDLALDVLSMLKEEADNSSNQQSSSEDNHGRPEEQSTDPLCSQEKGSLSVDKGKGEKSSSSSELSGNNHGIPSSQDGAKILNQFLEEKEKDIPMDMGQKLGEKLTVEAQSSGTKGESAGIGRASIAISSSGDPGAILAKVRTATSALTVKIKRFLTSDSRVKRSPRCSGKRLMKHRLVKGMLGYTNIFERKNRSKVIGADVEILLDRSSSMKQRISLAADCALALAAALEYIPNVTFSAVAFPGCNSDAEILTDTNEKVINTASRYAGLRASGGTPLLPALTWSLDRLIVRQKSKKVLMLISDGYPSKPDVCAKYIQSALLGGIEVIGIGIGAKSHQLGSIVTNFTKVDDIHDLASAMFNLLQATFHKKVA